MVKGQGETPPAQPVRVVPVPDGVPLVCRFLADYQGLETHWTGKGGTQACDGERCVSCLHGRLTVWKGYAAADFWHEAGRLWCPGILEVTESLEESLRGRKLRGEVWLLTRDVDRRAGRRVFGEYVETFGEEELPAAFPILPTLLRFFRRAALNLGAPNRTPPKTVLAPAPGRAPALPGAAAAPAPQERTAHQKNRLSEAFKRAEPKPSAGAAGRNGDSRS